MYNYQSILTIREVLFNILMFFSILILGAGFCRMTRFRALINQCVTLCSTIRGSLV